MGAWWNAYPVEEWDPEQILSSFSSSIRARLERANLRLRFYRVRSPFSAHVVMVTIEGEVTQQAFEDANK